MSDSSEPTTSDSRQDGGSFIERLRSFAAEFDERFDVLLEPEGDVPRELLEAIRYTALAPGKRLRPYLVSRCCELVGGSRNDAWHVGSAVECIHAFSLIHDDLPAMDDDDLRRGRPTCHRKFGEAVAILAGDALSMLAFELLTRQAANRESSARMVGVLAAGAGWSGMIGGQTADVLGESRPPALELAEYIHQRKTASLFSAACRLGAIAGRGEPEAEETLGRFGELLGRAFQITDDLLDVTSTATTMGKTVGKDENAGKQTFPECVGTNRSKQAAREYVDRAVETLAGFDERADDLRALARYVTDRNY